MTFLREIGDNNIVNAFKALQNIEDPNHDIGMNFSFLEDLENEKNKNQAINLVKQLENSLEIGEKIINDFLEDAKPEYREITSSILKENGEKLKLFAQGKLAEEILYYLENYNLFSIKSRYEEIAKNSKLFEINSDKYQKLPTEITEEDKRSLSYFVYKLDYFISDVWIKLDSGD